MGALIDVSNDIDAHISMKLEKNQDKMFDALEISKDILEYQPIVFGGSNDMVERWVSISHFHHLLVKRMNYHESYGWIRFVDNEFLQYIMDIDNIVYHNVWMKVLNL